MQQMILSAIIQYMFTQINRNCAVSIKSNRLMSCLSLATMCLLILASIVIITIISVTPIITLGLGQVQSGQRDFIIHPKAHFMNASRIEQLAQEAVMPRFQTRVLLNNAQQANAQQANAWLMDFQQEKQHHLGTLGGGEGFNHTYIYTHASLGFREGHNITVTLLDKNVFRSLADVLSNNDIDTGRNAEIINELNQIIADSMVNIRSQFTVRSVFADSSGKFAIGSTNNFVYLDINYAFQQMVNQVYLSQGRDLAMSPLIQFINSPSFSLRHFATEATINMPNRVEVYSNPDYAETAANLNKFAEKITNRIGIFSVDTEMPIAANLLTLAYIGMFIGVMLKLIIISLFMLSVIMMNNMLLMGVERKNFDFSLMKVMGANRAFIVINLLTSSLKSVFLANFIAYPLAYGTLQSLTGVFESFFGYRYEITPTFDAVLGGIIIGVMVPVISAIAPILDVINNDLVENLNPIRNKTEAIKIEVYIEGKEFPYGKLTFGLLATSYGLMIYYLLPKGLINQDIGLLLVIFFIILQGLLVGLILLSYSFQYLFEQVVAYMLLFWVNATDLMLTLKNLSSHRIKNRRSSILYSLSVSFIIFVSVGLQIQVDTIFNELLKKRGCYVTVSGNIDMQYYNNLLQNIDGVEDWAYKTQSLQQYLSFRGVKQIMISDKAKLFFAKNNVFGVSPNLINTFYYAKVSVYKTDAVAPYDPYSYLYSPEGYMTCTLSKYIANKFNILEGDNHQFYLNYYYADKVERIALNYSSVFDKRIGLLYSSILPNSQIGVSFDTFMAISGVSRYVDIPIREIKLKIRNPQEASQIADSIRRVNSNIDKVWDYSQLKSVIQRIENLLNNILTILLVVVLIISFFSLVTTTYINILNQTNQIGILLILGYEKFRIIKIYIYECFVLVINSCMIGIAVGYFVAWMMSLQRQLFSDLPVSIQINGLGIIVVAAIISSLLSTYKPLREIFSITISQIMNYSK